MPELKAEAVRQVVERRNCVAFTRLEASTQSLDKWIKVVTPDQSEKQPSERLKAKSESRRRAQLHQLKEARDYLKIVRYFARGSYEVSFHE